MNLKKLSKEELYEQIGIYLDRIFTVENDLEETYNEFMRDTYFAKLHEYRKVLNPLILEKNRRIEQGEIKTLSQQEYEEKFHDAKFFKDISVVFKVSHFQRIISGEIDQDYDINIELHIETKDDRYTASIQLPAGFKSGHLLKRENNCIYYTGIENEYDFEIFYDKNSVCKIIIHQKDTGASFIYI